jgi:hypothetical protein
MREIENLYSTSSVNYMEGFVSDSIDRLFELANLVIPDSGYWVWRENARFLLRRLRTRVVCRSTTHAVSAQDLRVLVALPAHLC